MNLNPSLLAIGSAFFSLLTSSAYAQSSSTPTPAVTIIGTVVNPTITTDVSPAGAGTSTVKAAGAVFTLTAKPNAAVKSVFLNWTISGVVVSTKSPYTFTPTASETVVANFGYVITTISSPTAGGKTGGAGTYPGGQSVTVTATPSAGYVFAGWTKTGRVGDLSTDASYTFTPGSGEALVANFGAEEGAITTSSSPASGGTTTGKGNYKSGSTVTVTAKAAAGYKFNGWMANGTIVSLANPYSFKAEGTEALTAIFADVSVPTVALTSPKAAETVASAFLTITGTANNVLGVSSVVLTVGGVAATVTTGNSWSNWTASVVLSPGANVISVHALSEVRTVSKTEIITVTDSSTGKAPGSLVGLIANVNQTGSPAFQVSFGTATYEQVSANANQGSVVGNYTYTQTGSSNATLILTSFAQPNQAGQSVSTVSLTFTSPTAASFTDTSGDSGSVTLSPGSTTDFSSLSGWTLVLTPTTAVTGSIMYPPGTLNAFDPANGHVPTGFANSSSASVILGPGDNIFRTGIPGDDDFTSVDFNGNTLTITENMFGFGASAWTMNFASAAFASLTRVSDNYINGGLVTEISPIGIAFSWAGSYTPVDVLTGTYTAAFNLTFNATTTGATTTFADATFASTDTRGTNTAGAYTSMQYGPMATMVVETNADPYAGGVETNSTMFFFTASGAGNFSTTHYDGAGDAPTYVSGSFTGTDHPSGVKYNAPASLNGMSFTVAQKSPAGPTINVSFGQATASQTASSTNSKSRVANYVYARTGPNTATVQLLDYLPSSSGGGAVYLDFTSPTLASYVEPSGQSAGSISVTVVPATDYFAPAALAQGTLVFHATTASHSGTATLNDGNFMIQNASGGGTSSGTYTYAQYSPTVGMLILTHTDPADAGDISYLQLTFNSAGGGSIVGDAYDTNSGGSTAVGTFTLAK